MPDQGSGPHFTPAKDKRGRVTRYRVELPRAEIVETQSGRFEATEYAERRSGWGGRLRNVEDRVIGSAMSSTRLEGERLSKKVALAIFSSDALSSTAYATQEIILILVIAGTGTLGYSLPIAGAIVALLGIVIVSYSQLIRAYPAGGGAYTVAHENLGRWPGLVAAASLLIDYTLTVAVSIAACVEAIVSAAPGVHPYAVPLAVGLVIMIALGNLRGVRESGTIFSIPTYGFVFILSATIIIGMIKVFFGDSPNILAVGTPSQNPIKEGDPLMWFLVLRAFSAGCAALTGVEAISNGVSSFKRPEWLNAIKTMAAMGLLLGFLFLGTTLLARHYGIVYVHGDRETVMSQVGEHVFGRNIIYYLLQGFTAGILFLAANTAFNGFPARRYPRAGRLPSANLPPARQPAGFQLRDRRTHGLCHPASRRFQRNHHAAHPALRPGGVPLLHTRPDRDGQALDQPARRGLEEVSDHQRFGGVVTAFVFVIILVTKFEEGGWMVVILIPVITLWLFRIGGFYKKLQRALHVAPEAVLDMSPTGHSMVPIVVPVEEINLATVMTLGAACERSRDVTAVHVMVDPDAPSTVAQRWRKQFPGVTLVVIDSPFRTVADPIASYVNDRLKESPHEVTVMIPSLEVHRWYHRPLVNQSLGRLTSLLARRRQVNIVRVPFSPGNLGRQKRRGAAIDV